MSKAPEVIELTEKNSVLDDDGEILQKAIEIVGMDRGGYYNGISSAILPGLTDLLWFHRHLINDEDEKFDSGD